MKKTLITSLSLLVLGACTKNLTDLNVDTILPGNVPSYSLFTGAEKTLADAVTSSNVNLNIFRLVAQHWQETTYTDESNYDISTRDISLYWWRSLYRDVLKDFDEAKKLIPTDVSDAAVQQNEIAIADILQVYSYYLLVNTFGDVPYSEALDIDNPFPKYDDAKTIYADLLTRLESDISSLNTGSGSYGGADIVYGGDVAAWKKFAITFKLKMGILLADSDPSAAKAAIESAVAAGVFGSNDDNALFQYLSGPPNTNPIWIDLVQSGRKDFVACSPVINQMKSLNDPRLPLYFTLDANGDYSGGDPGASSNYATFSKPAEKITAPDFPGVLLAYPEIEFILAEAVERGMNVGGTAEEHYNKAIAASIEFWGGSAGDAVTYLSNPAVNYQTAAGDWKQKIGIQKWIALYNQGFDAWTEVRRLDYPVLQAPEAPFSDFPVRFTYPSNEQNVNTQNWEDAASAIGGDDVTTKLFWDKN